LILIKVHRSYLPFEIYNAYKGEKFCPTHTNPGHAQTRKLQLSSWWPRWRGETRRCHV